MKRKLAILIALTCATVSHSLNATPSSYCGGANYGFTEVEVAFITEDGYVIFDYYTCTPNGWSFGWA